MRRFLTALLCTALLAGAMPAALAAPDYVGGYFDGRAAFSENGKTGFLDEEGRVVVPAVYDDVRVYDGGYARVAQWVGDTQRWGVLDVEGNQVLPLEYDWIGELSEGLRAASLNGKWGYLDEAFQAAIPYQFTGGAEDFEGGYAQVAMGDEDGTPLWGLIDRDGNQVIPCRYLWAARPEGGLSRVQSREELYGAVDVSTGEEAYPCRFRSGEALSRAIEEGVSDPDLLWKAAAQAGEDQGLSVTWYPECEGLMRRYGTDRMLLVKDGKSGLFGLDGTQYTAFVFDAVGEFDNQGQATAAKNGAWGKIDRNGGTVVDFVYATQEEAADEVGVRFVGQWEGQPPYALAALDGTLLTDYRYWAYRPFSHGYAMVTDGGEGWGYVDTAGREITPLQYGGFGALGSDDFGADGCAVVQYAGRGYNVIDGQGRELFAQRQGRKPWRAGLGLWGYETEDGVGFVDGAGRTVIQPQYFYQTNPKGLMMGNVFDEATGLAQVWDSQNSEPYYIDATGARATAPEAVDESALFHEGLVWTHSEMGTSGFGLDWGTGAWGFQDQAGGLAVPCLYDAVGYFDQGYASVQVDGVFGMLKNPLRREDASPWAAQELAQAREGGYVTPRCGTYQTYPITRLQFAELAVNYLEKATGEAVAPAPADTFSDTADEAVLKAYAAGIVQGTGEGGFSPDSPLTREQLSAMLWRAMERAGIAAEPVDLTAYADGEEVADWAAEGMAALVGRGVLEGTGENALSPKAPCTVEQAVLLVWRAAK